MTDQATQRGTTKARILDHALTLLRDSGDAGLTMRRLADAAQMSLGNLQYHYKTRDDVLTAMVGLHFESCIADLDAVMIDLKDLPVRERAGFLIRLGLKHGVELTDMCRIFRELWAISSRNEEVHQAMMAYYARFSERLATSVMDEEAVPGLQARLQCLMLPFLEGYSITGPALPMPMEDVATMLTDIVMNQIPEPSGHA